ncbi:helix-turn-helix transcriptional regulator [Candidatus Saccharibacteria bacterium oral taxon 488]|jgi:transcriptional regulator, hxlR family|nr:helix-turn-helix transcriptional regulator [Candidatus Saccharibacteria bacterium oral taxon 488]
MAKCTRKISSDIISNILFRKWTLSIVQTLGGDTRRYSELHRSLPDVTQKVLTEHLRALERAGIVRRFFYPTIPPRVEYQLTDMGLDLLELTKHISVWCDSHYSEVRKHQKEYDRKDRHVEFSS